MLETQVDPEYVVLVNAEDQVLGCEEKMKAHRLGLLHRAFSIFVYRKQGNTLEFLLQQRHPDKYHSGGLWTNACCSHPRVDESISEAATRRLQEELSLTLPLKHLSTFIYQAEVGNGLIEHEFDHVFVGEFLPGMEIRIDPQEIIDYRWSEQGALIEDVKLRAHQFTPWFKSALEIVMEHTCKY